MPAALVVHNQLAFRENEQVFSVHSEPGKIISWLSVRKRMIELYQNHLLTLALLNTELIFYPTHKSHNYLTGPTASCRSWSQINNLKIKYTIPTEINRH